MNENVLLTEFHTAYLCLELETKQKLTINELVEWGVNWWNERKISLLETTILGLLNSWRDVVFFTLEILEQVEQAIA